MFRSYLLQQFMGTCCLLFAKFPPSIGCVEAVLVMVIVSGFLFPKWCWHPNFNLSSVPWFDSSKVLKVVCVRCLRSQTPGGATFNSRASTITRAVSMGDLVASTTIVSVTSPHTSESYYTCERITSRIQISRASAVPTPSATVLHHEITIQCAREIKFMWGEHEKKYAWERENEWGGDSFPLIYSFSLITSSPPSHLLSWESMRREKVPGADYECVCATFVCEASPSGQLCCHTRALHLHKRALHPHKRALHLHKRALHLHKRALHLHKRYLSNPSVTKTIDDSCLMKVEETCHICLQVWS